MVCVQDEGAMTTWNNRTDLDLNLAAWVGYWLVYHGYLSAWPTSLVQHALETSAGDRPYVSIYNADELRKRLHKFLKRARADPTSVEQGNLLMKAQQTQQLKALTAEAGQRQSNVRTFTAEEHFKSRVQPVLERFEFPIGDGGFHW